MMANLDKSVLGHPPRHELVAYAENLVDRRAAVSAAMAAHLAACPRCAAEVRAIRASLELAAAAPEQEPPDALARQILTVARQARQSAPAQGQNPLVRLLAGSLRGAAYAATLAVLAALVFQAALSSAAGTDTAAAPGTPRMAQGGATAPESLWRKAGEVARLSAAVTRQEAPPRSPREWEKRRVLDGMNADLSAALAALERNPGCTRANALVQSRLHRQAEGLRALFIERTL